MIDLSGAPAGLQARRLDGADIAACAALSAEAGWNQTARDWAIMLELGRGVGLLDALPGGPLVASAVALPYDGAIGFISMVLVTPAWQRRGIARWLTERCAVHLESLGRTPVLDATPAGQGVYRKLGFTDGIALDRWRAERVAMAHVPVSAGITLHPLGDVGAIIAHDARVFGARRAPVLSDLHARRSDLAWAATHGATLVGFALGRDGRTATHIGPVVAADDATAAALLAQALRGVAGAAIVDLVRGHDRLAALLADAGFAAVRSFTRMHRGDAPPAAAELAAAIGPEFG